MSILVKFSVKGLWGEGPLEKVLLYGLLEFLLLVSGFDVVGQVVNVRVMDLLLFGDYLI